MMSIREKKDRLVQVYEIFDVFIEKQATACKPGCATCCTRNVTMTTLEGWHVIDRSPERDGTVWMQALRAAAGEKRFQPKVTLNTLANLCAMGEDLPDEDIDPNWGKCPVLTDETCPVYPLRPFSCRCMVSVRPCAEAGIADMDPFIITVSTVFQQFIEHIDVMGCTGNFTDILQCLGSAENRKQYENGRLLCQGLDLLPNRPLKHLMVPPEHRERIAPIWEALNAVRGGRSSVFRII